MADLPVSDSRGSDEAADDGDAACLGGNLLDGLAIARDKRWPLDQIARRISAHRQLGKQNQSRAAGLRAPGKLDDLCRVAGEISDRGIDLAERNLHMFSVKQESRLRLSGFGLRLSKASAGGWFGYDPDKKNRGDQPKISGISRLQLRYSVALI